MNCQIFTTFLAVIICSHYAYTQNEDSPALVTEVKICVRSVIEAIKCETLSSELAKMQNPIQSTIRSVSCVEASDSYKCLKMINDGDADIVNLDAGTAYYASINYVSTLFLREKFPMSLQRESPIYSVVVLPKSSNINKLTMLKSKRLCSTGVDDAAGWTLPLSKLVELGILTNTDCNVKVKSAASFFSSMCAPGALTEYHNPFGDNPVSSCEQCGTTGRDWCTYRDMYAGSEGPLLCLKDRVADVGFMRSVDLEYLTTSHHGEAPAYDPNAYKLLCPDGTTTTVTGYDTCNWGEVKPNVLVTSAAKSPETRNEYITFFEKLAKAFPPLPDGSSGSGTDSNDTVVAPTATPTTQTFTLFNSDPKYGLNSLFSSAAIDFQTLSSVEDGFNYAGGVEYQKKLDNLLTCPVDYMRFCVVSEYEMRKCENMLLALGVRNLKPVLDCILDNSTQNCMRKIEDGDADVIILDAGDIYEAGKYFDLVPFANENYGDTGNFYYSVAVSRKTESKLTLFNLMAHNSCHGSMRSATGWIYPVLSLIETGQITPGKCDAIKKVGELFRRSCVPGILDDQYNAAGTNPVNLCENCAAGGMDKCQRNTRELYYGDSGAFRCLVENGGDIAYVRHMTPRDNTDGRNSDHWARNRRSDDYELLCKNGRRAPLNSWKSCYLAKVPARAVVTAGYKTASEKAIFWNLLNYAQQFYSADSHSYFTMFDSGVDQDDLLFSDSTVRLVEVEPDKQSYTAYLGVTFLKAVNTLNQFDCTSGQATVSASIVTFIFTFICHRLLI